MSRLKILALAGGGGGAKLTDGLAQVVNPGDLTIIVNTGDDFTHLGLRISPDLDTVCYTLAGMEDPETGWGRRDETWKAFENLHQLGMPGWFRLGDADLATHITRTQRIGEGWSLSRITRDFCQVWGVRMQVLPMSDDVVQTLVHSDEGDLPFQEYFVHRKCAPIVSGFSFIGAENSAPAEGVLAAIESADAVVISPSNPWVSIDPILSVPGIKKCLEGHMVIAVSPIIGDKTIKGPAAKMFTELGIQPSAFAVAQHYQGIIDGLVIDHRDDIMAEKISTLGIRPFITDILMRDREDRVRLAREVIEFITEQLKVME